MSLQQLQRLLVRPALPSETPEIRNWNSVEQQIGTKLPADYKEFVENYGSGIIDGFLVIFNPFSQHKFINLIQRGSSERSAYVISKEEFPQYYTHDVFPQQGGLLPLGASENGEVMYWKTCGLPENWPIVVYESRGPKYFVFDGDITSFLAGLIGREVRCSVFPNRFPSEAPKFTSL